jgi:hypothetical protein
MISQYFNMSAQLLRPFITEIDGSPVETFASVGAPFPVALDKNRGFEALVRDKIDGVGEFIVYCDIRDIRQTDRLRINGAEYEVLFVDNPVERNSHLEIDLRRVV